MYKKALEVLNIFNEHGYLAYIVGGYVRDMLLDKKSFDIDICASATPREIMELFDIEKQSEINFFAEFTKSRKHFFSNFKGIFL